MPERGHGVARSRHEALAMNGPKAARLLRDRAASLRKLVREQMSEDEPKLADDLSQIADDLEARAKRLERVGEG
ncbi:MAG: hypothetical protein ACLQJR_17645 [Stellaceae bacterium]